MGNPRRPKNLIGAVVILLTVAIALAGCAAKSPTKDGRKSSGGDSPLLPSLSALRMLDDRAGWAVGGSSVFRTDDGWASWADVTPGPRSKSATRLPVVAESFLDATHAWVATGGEGGPVTIFRTADGGRTWTPAKQQLAGSGLQLSFIDATTGFALVHLGVAMGSEAVAIMATTDGGANWKVRYQTDPQGVGGGLPFGGLKTGFGFRDAEVGWVTGYRSVEGRAYLYGTTDGGSTWQQVALGLPSAYATAFATTRPPFFVSAKDGFLPASFGLSGQPTCFYATHDGGRTWNPGAPVTSPSNNSFTWSFADARNGFATDGEKLFATTDGGAKWVDVKPGAGFTGIRRVAFISDQVGWAIGEEVFIKTTDGGKTWTRATDK